MVKNFKIVLLGDTVLAFFDGVVMKFNDDAAIHAYHMIMVIAVGKLKNGAFAKVMAQY